MLDEHSQPARAHRPIETLAVGAAALVSAALLAALAPALDRFAAWLAVALALLSSYVVSDLFSGLVHWSFDRIFEETTPLIGPHFVRPFREHHEDPTEITRHDFVELNGNTCIAAVPVLSATLWAIEPGPGEIGAVFAVAFIVFLALWSIGTNQFHQWAHESTPPPLARRLQRWHVVISSEHHAGHHRPPFSSHYCITSGIMNGWVDRVGLFAALEAGIGSLRRRS